LLATYVTMQKGAGGAEEETERSRHRAALEQLRGARIKFSTPDAIKKLQDRYEAAKKGEVGRVSGRCFCRLLQPAWGIVTTTAHGARACRAGANCRAPGLYGRENISRGPKFGPEREGMDGSKRSGIGRAVRKGPIYCAPACGGGCTKAAYDAAVRKSRALAKRMGKGWVPYVWEKLGLVLRSP